MHREGEGHSHDKLVVRYADAALGVVVGGGGAFAVARDEYAKILGYDWSGKRQLMYPADMHSGDYANHTFAVYNRLEDVEDNFFVLPEWKRRCKIRPR
ncbi:MAG: hypothetical protein ACK5QX_09660 [bacterium]